jgi:hypothetical protein
METLEYLGLVGDVVSANRAEIEGDLRAAKRLRDAAEGNLVEAERKVASYEFLLSLAGSVPTGPAERMTLHAAMRAVLESAPGRRMPATELAREINRRGMYQMRDGRAVEPQQIHARAGNYPDFDRNERGIGLI